MSLEERLARLEALRAIESHQAHYAALADAKYLPTHQRVRAKEWQRIAALQAACFTEDAIWDGGADFGGARQGRAALTDWFTISPWRFALHFYQSPQITITSATTADAIWRLWQIAIHAEADTPVLLAAITIESYRCVEENWLISHMRFTQIHTTALPASLKSLIPA